MFTRCQSSKYKVCDQTRKMQNHELNTSQKLHHVVEYIINEGHRTTRLKPKGQTDIGDRFVGGLWGWSVGWIGSYSSWMEKYRIVKSIGDGSFGVVFKAVAPSSEIVAIKKMKAKYKSWEECNVLREIKCLRKLDHPHIVKLQEVILANCELFMVFDYLDSNLYQVYTRALENNRSLTEHEIKSIFFKIASGLAYLHRNGFFHRDLKPENILCHNNDVKLCDFGLAREIRSRPPFTEYVSTRWYRAPELLLHGGYNSPVDIFALAAIVAELYLMAPLFPGATEIETMNRIVELLGTPTRNEWPEGYKMASTIHYNFPDKKKRELSDLLPNASPEAIDLLESMFAYSPRKRPSASEILKHEYFASLHEGEQGSADPKNETKFSFYEKNIIEIPTNLPTEVNQAMDMRKSLIKFGTSFGSTFHKDKQQKHSEKHPHIQRHREHREGSQRHKDKSQLELILESPKEERSRKESHPQHDEIAKKFDEMEEILMALQKKEKEERRYDHDSPAKLEPTESEYRMPLFQFGGIGSSSFSGLGSLKNVKSPIFMKSRPGDSK